MKNFTLFILLMGLGFSYSYAQLTAIAGNDTISCEGDTLQLGSVSATGGTSPYTYIWETIYTVGSLNFHASTFLNDTTIPNPKIVARALNGENISFKLTVIDALNNTDTGSVVVMFSNFGFQLIDYFEYINQGDSVQLFHTIGAGIPPLTYLWTPNYNISNPNLEYPWVKPDTTTFYNCTVTDAVGCQSDEGDIFQVYVNAVGINESGINTRLTTYPNPTKDYIHLTLENNLAIAEITLYDITGRLVREYNLLERKLSVKELKSGQYILKIETEIGLITKKIQID